MPDINIKIDAFEGPFELLYDLIEKNEIDIYDIPISELAGQYMAAVHTLPPDAESLSSFLVMAATLLEIKSKMLLPPPNKPVTEEDADPRKELMRKLLEYRQFKDITEILRQREEESPKVVFKEAENSLLNLIGSRKTSPDELLNGINPENLLNIVLDIVKRKELKVDKIRASYGVIKNDGYTVEESIAHIRSIMKFRKRLVFSEIFDGTASRSEVIITFIALLELIRLREISINQNNIFGDILIKAV